ENIKFDQIEFEEEVLENDFEEGETGPPDYEFLDIPSKKDTTTQFSSPFDTDNSESSEPDFNELPNFEQFTFEDSPNFEVDQETENYQEEAGYTEGPPEFMDGYQQEEPGLAVKEPGLLEESGLGSFGELEALEPEDEFSSAFTDSFESRSTKTTSIPITGTIMDQSFPIKPQGSTEHTPTKQEMTPPKTISRKAPEKQPPQQPAEPVEVQASINTEQLDALMAALSTISSKLDKIDHEQTQQKIAIEELKQAQKDFKQAPQQPAINSEEITTKIEELSNSTQGMFSRMESKIDIIVQTDPLDQIDSLLGELADSIQEEQGNLETKLEDKITEISSSLDSIISLIDSEEPIKDSNYDFTELINNTHQMLLNLESNIKEDQEKSDQKIEDLATIIDGMTIILENIPSDTKEGISSIKTETIPKIEKLSTTIEELKDTNSALEEKIETNTGQLNAKIDNFDIAINNIDTKINSFNSNFSHVNVTLNDINDTINNVNNTVGAIIELSQINQENNEESQIYEAFYDFEFRLQLELEKNQNKLNNLENLFVKTNENLDKINQHSAKLNDYSIEKLDNIPELLNNIKKELAIDIEHTEQHTTALKNTIDDMIIQLESVFGMQLEGLKHHLNKELTNINNKLNHIIEEDKVVIDVELNNKADALLQLGSQTQINLNNFGINIESILNSNNQLGALVTGINNKLNSVNQDITTLHQKIEKSSQDSKMDEETRSIFEHVLLQVNEASSTSKKSSEVLTKKVEDMELDLQMTLKDMDRRINKINSMIRNVYKALDSITDLITESSRSSLGLNKPRPKLQKEEDDD
ncbi:MAG: hypothetical protein AB7V50_04940, partial [Vampirovibrionia bacterium]